MDIVIGHFYDSVVYYGNMITQLVASGQGDPTDVIALQKLIDGNFTFDSPINGKVHMDADGDRIFNLVLRSFSLRTSSYEVWV